MIYIFLSVVGAYVVRTSTLNDKHSCQLFRMGLRDKTTPTPTTPLIKANRTCAVATIFSSLAFLSLSVSMANLSHLVAASFSSFALLSSSVSTANLSGLLATTFSNLRFLSSSLLSPRFNLMRVARHCFSGLLFLTIFSSLFCFFLFSFLLYLFHILSAAFLSSVLQSLKLCLL